MIMPNRSAALSAVPAARRGAADPRIAIPALCAAVALALAVPGIKSGVFDAMSTADPTRLVEVNDLIAGQGWFDLMQYRLDPPGLLMHWSRVIDAPLAALILMLRPLAGAHGAEAITLVLWPTLLFAATLLLIAAIAKRMSDAGDRQKTQLLRVLSHEMPENA